MKLFDLDFLQDHYNLLYEYFQHDYECHKLNYYMFQKYNFSNIINSCSEDKDYAWGMENLHKIRSKLEKTSPPPEEIIGEENVKLYDKFNI